MEVGDQAETLRRLMRERPKSDSDTRSARVLAFAGSGPGAGTSSVLANIAAILARSGWKVAAVELEKNPRVSLIDAFGAGPFLSNEPVYEIEQDLWLVPAIERADESSLTAKAGCAEVAFLDLGSGGSAQAEEHSKICEALKAEYVIVLTPRPTSVAEACSRIGHLKARLGRLQAGVIVNQARDGAEAQKLFRSLKANAERISGVELEYLGHCGRDEKFSQAVRNRKILLDLESGALSVRCFELLAKRFLGRYLRGTRMGTGSGSESGFDAERIVTKRRLPPSRFREEPARSAPGNKTGFWRILLGEVKA
ncbi:MAG: hypothetical protein A2X94_06755 [Bdellovibrionales bacterium GWB1_55_8]|nr:MAG: hypothetical protein A2X94_06755 [Bdellovibrionales bacterium GWB1_55_8]